MKIQSYLENRSIFKIGLSLLMIIVIIILLCPISQRYEISIYNMYPWYFWISLIFIMLLGILVSINQVFNSKVSKFWIRGYLLIIFTNMLILLLPLIRRYQCYSGIDVFIHIGLIKDIIHLGHFGAPGMIGENVYPILHIFISEIYFITNISPELLSMIIPIFFIIIYILSIYLLAKLISSTKNQIILITIFGSLMSFGYQNSILFPSFDSFLLLPIVIFLYLKVKEKSHLLYEFRIILIIFLIFYPFIHPGEGTLFLVLSLLIIEIFFLIFRNKNLNVIINDKKNKKFYSNYWGKDFHSSFNLIILLIGVWLVWILNLSILKGLIYTLEKLFNESNSEFSSISNTIQNVGMSNFELFNLTINTFGNAILFISLAIIFSLLIIKKSYEQKRIDLYNALFIFLFASFFLVISFSFFFSIGFRGIQRSLVYLTFYATILNGLLLLCIYNNKYKKIFFLLTVIFLIICGSLTIFNAHPSPKIKLPNPQVTQMEYTGMEWFFTHQNDDLLIDSRGVSQFGYANMIFGTSNIPKNIRASSSPPDHFGYNNHKLYGENINQERYYIDNIISRTISPEIFPEYQKFWTFNPQDFERMDKFDVSSSKLFSNGEFWVYLIRPR